MSQLVKCTGCSRHLRVSETACPFCAAPLDVDQRIAAARAISASIPARRLSRAALLAVGLGALAPVTGACGSDDDGGSIFPLYGGFSGDASVTLVDSSLPTPAYGLSFGDAAFELDASPPADASDASHASDAGDAPDAQDAQDAADGGDADAD